MLIGDEDMYRNNENFTTTVRWISENAKVFYADSKSVLECLNGNIGLSI